MPSAGSRSLVIDARPRGPRGPLAGEQVLDRSVLDHLVEVARSLDTGPIAIHARVDEHESLRKLLQEQGSEIEFRTGPPPENAAILRADRLYDSRRLRRVINSGRDPETAVIWRLDRTDGLESANAELLRRTTYQPLGRFWAWVPARSLASLLAPTRIRPNSVTLAAAALMFGAAALLATGSVGWIWCIATAICLAAALILDTADGHLARLQGTASEFGRWLDVVLDELAEMVLHASIAWGMFARTGSASWIGVGMLYAIGKYVFTIARHESSPTSTPTKPAAGASPSIFRRAVRLIGHADVRWHLWIVLALFGRLEWALVAYSGYFPLRIAGIAARKAVERG